MREPRSAVLLLAALVAAGCSGRDKAEIAAIYTLSGTAFAAGGNAADGDTGDRDPSASRLPNDSVETAQALPSAVTLGGWVSSLDDPSDYYRATLAQGQVVRLVPTDGVAELDLELFVAGASTTTVSANDGPRAAEAITVPADGEHYVRVFARPSSGASTYQLTIGPAASGAAAPAVGGGQGDGELPSAEFVPGQVIVRFQDLPRGAPADTLEERARAVGLVPVAGGARREMLMEIGRGSDRARAVRVLGLPAVAAGAPGDPAGRKADALRAVEALRARADVKHADLNYLVHAAAEPDDPLYAQQWQYPLIKLPQAWELTTGMPASGAVVVAVLDTGIAPTHPELSGKLEPGYDFVSDPFIADDGGGRDADPTDPGDSQSRGQSTWHGTHVAGTVGAASDNGIGVAGVSWHARILPVRVLGLGGFGTTFDIFEGVRWAAGLVDAPGRPAASGPRAQVLNLSLGCQGCYQSVAQDLFDEVSAAGVVVVAAAGNVNSSVPSYPASYEHVVSVSAVDFQGRRAWYSNYGPKVDVAAPGGGGGSGVLSTAWDDTNAAPTYKLMQGTSMAAPHVAGVVALMKAVCPTLGPAQVDVLLQSGRMTTDAGAPGRDDDYGWGIVDALASVQSALAECGEPVPAVLDVDPVRLDFAPSAVTTAVITVSRSGTGDFSAPVAFGWSGTWLTVTEGAVDPATGLGTYLATIDPTGVSTGAYTASVTFTVEAPTGPQAVTVPVTLRVGGTTGGGDAGHVYFLLIDASLTVLDVRAVDPIAGAYPYSFPVDAGTYFVVAGSDLDGDEWICEQGESCGAYPAGGFLTEIPIDADRSGLDFSIGFDVAIGAGASSWLPREGFPVRAGAAARTR